MKKIVDYLYKKSILKYFAHIQRIDNPHFAVNYQVDNDFKTRYESMDHFTVESKMQTRYLKTIEKNYDINTNEEFINNIVHEGNQQLNNYLINYIDKNSDILKFPFYKLSKLEKLEKIYHKFFEKNYRFSIKNKKINIKHKEYFQGIIKNIIKEEVKSLHSCSYDDNYYIISSEDLADLLTVTMHRISDPVNNSFFHYGYLYHGVMGSKTISIFINKKQPEKTLYIGCFNSLDSSRLRFYYYSHDNVLTEHLTLSDSPFKIFRLNLYHKLIDTKNHKFKKVIFK